MPSKPTFYVLLGISKGRKLIRWKRVPELVPDAKERHSHIAVVLIRSDAHPSSEFHSIYSDWSDRGHPRLAVDSLHGMMLRYGRLETKLLCNA
jgi:hypothetical protein